MRGQDGQPPTLSQSRCRRLECKRWFIDDLEHLMTDDDIRAGRLDHIEQRGSITENSANVGADRRFFCSSLEGCERIRAGVDDEDKMAELSDSHRQTSGATTEIDDLQRSLGIHGEVPCSQHLMQRIPHRCGAQGAATTIHC